VLGRKRSTRSSAISRSGQRPRERLRVRPRDLHSSIATWITSPVRFLSLRHRPMHRATLSLTNPCGLLRSLSSLQHQYHTTRPSRISEQRAGCDEPSRKAGRAGEGYAPVVDSSLATRTLRGAQMPARLSVTIRMHGITRQCLSLTMSGTTSS